MTIPRALLAALVCGLTSVPAFGQEKPDAKQPQEIDKATVEAWTKGGFTPGYMGTLTARDGELVFMQKAEGLHNPVPAFFLGRQDVPQTEALFLGLPTVKVPFGLHLSNWRGTIGHAIEDLVGQEHLTYVNFAGTNISNKDIEVLVSELKALSHLDLSETGVTGPGLKHVAGLKNLTYLALIGNRVPGVWLKYLAGSKTLTHLALDCRAVPDSDLRHLAGVSNLTHLELTTTQFRERLRPFSVVGLTGDTGKVLTVEGARHLSNLKSLTVLVLAADVSDDTLKHISGLKGLRYLDLQRSHEVTDEGLEHLRGLADLGYLNLRDQGSPSVTKEGMVKLRKALPKCDIHPNR